MSSHVHKLMQVYVFVSYAHLFFLFCFFFFFFLFFSFFGTITYLQVLGESLYISGKYLDYDKKLVEAQSRIASLSVENKSLTIQISVVANEAKKYKDCLKTLEKNIDTDEALKKVKKAGLEAVEKFRLRMSSQTSSIITTWTVLNSFVSTWPGITLRWTSPSSTWKKWRGKS